MAQPTPYNRQFNFQNQQALTPTAPLPADELDGELNAVKVTIDQTLVNLAKIQRDDGALKNGIVTQESLSGSLSIGFTFRGTWESGVNYAQSDGVSVGSLFYKAKQSHLSSGANEPPNTTFWDQIADLTSLVIPDGSLTIPQFNTNVFANQAQSEAGVEDDLIVTPEGVRQFAEANGSLRTLRSFGLVADGVTDNTGALNTALAAGVKLSGQGLSYGVVGDVEIPSGTHLEDVTIKQLDPNQALRKTLTNTSPIANITLRRVKVDRNGDGTVGTPGESGGIFFEDIEDFLLEDCEVYGNGKGCGIMLRDATDGRLVRPLVRDMAYDDTAVANDAINGIYLETCTRVQVEHPIVRDLSGNPGGVSSNRFTRGITVVGTTDCALVAPAVANVDQGVDVSGATFNRRLSILGGNATNCYTFGFKFANSASSSRIIGAVATDCGLAGFVVSGPTSAGQPDNTSYIEVIGCEALNTGSNGVYSASNTIGFSVQSGTFNVEYPHGVRFIGCRARDTQTVKTMKYGFRNNVTLTSTTQFNETLDCYSEGHTILAFSGFHSASVKLKRSAVQSIPNSTATAIVWDQESFDFGLMHSTSVAPQVVTLPRSGFYNVQATIYWAQNVTGLRTISILLNGVAVEGGYNSGPTTNNDFTQSVSTIVYCEKGDNVRVDVTQSSGGALNVRQEFSAFVVTPLRMT